MQPLKRPRQQPTRTTNKLRIAVNDAQAFLMRTLRQHGLSSNTTTLSLDNSPSNNGNKPRKTIITCAKAWLIFFAVFATMHVTQRLILGSHTLGLNDFDSDSAAARGIKHLLSISSTPTPQTERSYLSFHQRTRMYWMRHHPADAVEFNALAVQYAHDMQATTHSLLNKNSDGFQGSRDFHDSKLPFALRMLEDVKSAARMVMKDESNGVLNDVDFTINVNEAWVNVHRNKARNIWHSHSTDAQLSVVYYAATTPNCRVRFAEVSSQRYSEILEVPLAAEGMILVFPQILRHEVPATMDPEECVSFEFDITVDIDPSMREEVLERLTNRRATKQSIPLGFNSLRPPRQPTQQHKEQQQQLGKPHSIIVNQAIVHHYKPSARLMKKLHSRAGNVDIASATTIFTDAAAKDWDCSTRNEFRAGLTALKFTKATSRRASINNKAHRPRDGNGRALRSAGKSKKNSSEDDDEKDDETYEDETTEQSEKKDGDQSNDDEEGENPDDNDVGGGDTKTQTRTSNSNDSDYNRNDNTAGTDYFDDGDTDDSEDSLEDADDADEMAGNSNENEEEERENKDVVVSSNVKQDEGFYLFDAEGNVQTGTGTMRRCVWERHMKKQLTEKELDAIEAAATAVSGDMTTTAQGINEIDSDKSNNKKSKKEQQQEKKKKRKKNMTLPLNLDETLKAVLMSLLNAAMYDLVKLAGQLKGTSGNPDAAANEQFFMDPNAAKFTQLRIENIQSFRFNGFDDAAHIDGASAFFRLRWGQRPNCYKFEFPFAAVWVEPKFASSPSSVASSSPGGQDISSGTSPRSSKTSSECALVLRDRRSDMLEKRHSHGMFDNIFMPMQYEYGQVTLPLTGGTILLLPHETGTNSIVRGLIGPNTDECSFVFIDICAKGP